MSKISKFLSVLTQLETAMKTIDGSSGYNFDIDDKVFLGFKIISEVDYFPSLYIASLSEGESDRMDQRTNKVPVTVNFIGYVKDEDDPLTEAVKLAEDVEKCTYRTDAFDCEIINPSLAFDEITTFHEYGLVIGAFRCDITYQIPQ